MRDRAKSRTGHDGAIRGLYYGSQPNAEPAFCMKFRSPVIIALFIFGAARCFGGDVTADRSAEIKAQVVAAYDQSIAAAEALDLDSLFGALGNNDNGALIANGRMFLSRTEVIDSTRTNFQGIRALKYEVGPRRVTVLSPTAALLVTNGTLNGETVDGARFTRSFAHTVVYVRENGRWLVLHTHQSNPRDGGP